MRFLPVGDAAVLVELDDLAATLALFRSLDAARPPGVTELVPGARTVLVRFSPVRVAVDELIDAILDVDVDDAGAVQARTVDIPVRYEGEDLDEVAELLGIPATEVVRRHTEGEYTVAFTGFAPGFAYLSGGHQSLDVPRRTTPRTRIPAGAVGLAGTFSGVYPRESPGGWQIIGTTETPMWNLGRVEPALLRPGDHVRFVDVTAEPRAGNAGATTAPAAPAVVTDGSALEVLDGGMLTVLQDLGRAGNAALGVSPSGALDPVSLRAANRLVGNDPGEAALELVYGGLVVRSVGDSVIATAGAPAPITVTRTDGRSVTAAFGVAVALAHGDVVVVGAPTGGIRSYVAVRGGFAFDPVLGSLSTDTLSGLGPSAVVAGDTLPISTGRHTRPVQVGLDAITPPLGDGPVTLDIVLGPRTDWFTSEAVELLCASTFTVTPQSNRVGLRLAGDTPLERAVDGELPSEGTIAGSLQVPPSGQPVLFLADHPLTGGYPVIACVASHHLARAGQLPIGAEVRFRVAGPFAEYTAATPSPTAETPTGRAPKDTP